jgi:hypothetical protein
LAGPGLADIPVLHGSAEVAGVAVVAGDELAGRAVRPQLLPSNATRLRTTAALLMFIQE